MNMYRLRNKKNVKPMTRTATYVYWTPSRLATALSVLGTAAMKIIATEVESHKKNSLLLSLSCLKSQTVRIRRTKANMPWAR